MSRSKKLGRPLYVDVLVIVGSLAIAAWRTFDGGRTPTLFALVVVACAALAYGAVVGWWAKSGRSRPIALAILMFAVIGVFIFLVGVRGPFEDLQWAWLLVAFAGLTIGAALGERGLPGRVQSRRRAPGAAGSAGPGVDARSDPLAQSVDKPTSHPRRLR